LSQNRQRLIRAILDQNPDCRLFAVGDDWQSIYRFAGSDLRLIREFEQVFNRHVRRSFIETTHRFGRPTTYISSDFIQRNRLQTKKRVRPSSRSPTPIKIFFGNERDNDVATLERIIAHCGEDFLAGKKVQIISRYNSDIRRLESPDIEITPKGNDIYDISWRDKLHFEFCSMHKSKGITRDIVIVLNMSSSANGMPATRPLDPLIDALLAPEEEFAYAEERRLFYVAITRAREQTFLIADRKHPSPFILEINEELSEAIG
jgi:DNA helicase-4